MLLERILAGFKNCDRVLNESPVIYQTKFKAFFFGMADLVA